MQQLVGNDGVVHSHTTFIKHAQDGFVALQMGSHFTRGGLDVGRQLKIVQRMNMTSVVTDRLTLEPEIKSPKKEIVREIDAPQRVVANAGFSQRSVEIEHADQSWPFAAPVGDSQDRPSMRVQSVQ